MRLNFRFSIREVAIVRNALLGHSRLVAGLAILSLVLATGPAPLVAAAAPGASIAGRVFLSDARTPVREAVVKAFNRDSEKTFESPATGPDGAYALDGLEPGEYDLGISTGSGLFLVETSVKVSPGQKRAASFALQPYTQEQGDAQGSQQGEGQQAKPEDQKPSGQAEKPKKLKRPRSAAATMHNPWVVTGVIVGGALVIGAISSSVNDSNGSPN
jgi:carboxypeptidase family protein